MSLYLELVKAYAFAHGSRVGMCPPWFHLVISGNKSRFMYMFLPWKWKGARYSN